MSLKMRAIDAANADNMAFGPDVLKLVNIINRHIPGETMPNVILSALVTLILKLSHNTNQQQPIADVLRKVAFLMDGA
jgi:enhancing lycopene biosynthesis protein 2